MNVFAYNIDAELNRDGTYKVRLFDVDSDEHAEEMIIRRAKITIEIVLDDLSTYDWPLLDVEKWGS